MSAGPGEEAVWRLCEIFKRLRRSGGGEERRLRVRLKFIAAQQSPDTEASAGPGLPLCSAGSGMIKCD